MVLSNEMEKFCVYCCVFIERKTGGVIPSYDSIRKASLDRPKSGTPEKWDGYNSEDFGLVFDNFRPVTLTVSSFYKQVAHQSRSVFFFYCVCLYTSASHLFSKHLTGYLSSR